MVWSLSPIPKLCHLVRLICLSRGTLYITNPECLFHGDYSYLHGGSDIVVLIFFVDIMLFWIVVIWFPYILKLCTFCQCLWFFRGPATDNFLGHLAWGVTLLWIYIFTCMALFYVFCVVWMSWHTPTTLPFGGLILLVLLIIFIGRGEEIKTEVIKIIHWSFNNTKSFLP